VGEPRLDERLRVVNPDFKVAERDGVGRRDPRGPGGRMEDGDPREARVRWPGVARPVEGERRAGGEGGEPRRDRGAIREDGDGRPADGGDRCREVFQEPRELELHPEGPKLRPVGLAPAGRLEVERERHVPVERRQLAGEERVLAPGGERLAQLAGDERQVLVESLDRAELADELHGRFLPHPVNALDVVDRVTHERQHVGDLPGLDAPPLAHLRLVVQDGLPGAARDGEDAHARADELEEILVTGDDHDLEVGPLEGAGDEGGEDVVGLEARDLDHRDPERLEQALDVGELPNEVVGHRRAGRLVLGGERVPERGPGGVPGDREVVGLLLAAELPEHRAKDQHRLRRDPLGGREVADRVVGAEELRVTVDHVERLHARLHRSPSS